MIGSQAAGFVHRTRIAALEQEVLFGAHDEKCGAEREEKETLEIDVAAIHHVEGARLGQNFVEDVDVVHFAFGNADKRGDAAAARSSSVCILTVALCWRNRAHGNSERQRSMVVESSAYRL